MRERMSGVEQKRRNETGKRDTLDNVERSLCPVGEVTAATTAYYASRTARMLCAQSGISDRCESGVCDVDALWPCQ